VADVDPDRVKALLALDRVALQQLILER
jgi:hypothetical protein